MHEVYRYSLLLTGIFSIIDGFKAAGIPLQGLNDTLGKFYHYFTQEWAGYFQH